MATDPKGNHRSGVRSANIKSTNSKQERKPVYGDHRKTMAEDTHADISTGKAMYNSSFIISLSA